MSTERKPSTPVVLLVDDQEWTVRSIESILRPHGYVVLKAYTGRQARELVGKVAPDLIVVDLHLPDVAGVELAEELRSSPGVSAYTPLLMMTSATVSRVDRIAALKAGAWGVLRHPLDPQELVLQLGTLVRAKQEADDVREQGLTDPVTGLYNVRGLLRRTTEISADALRSDRPLACIAFGTQWPGDLPPDAEELPRGDAAEAASAQEIAWVLGSATRLSDTIGMLGTGEFVVVAPGTSREGALRLADRVLEMAMAASPGEGSPPLPLRAGYCSAVASREPLNPEDLLFKATIALRRAQSDPGGFRVRSYEA